MGLGILRNNLYKKYVHEQTFSFQQGDILVLYTDGIVEAKNSQGVEFGYERLKNVLNESSELNVEQIQNKIIQEVYAFIGKNRIADDDYSLMVIKFK